MRILQVHNFHSEGAGGAVDVLEQEASMLTAAGHAVERFTSPPAEELGVSAVRAGVKAVWNLDGYRAVSEMITDFRADVVHVHIPFPMISPAVFRAAQRLRVPAVTTVHNYQYSCVAGTFFRDGKPCEDCVGTAFKGPGLRHRCYHDSLGASAALTLSLAVHRRLGTFSRSVSRFIALTDFSKDILLRDGVPADHVVVKPNSVADPGPSIASLEPTNTVVFAGRLIDLKGVRTLLDAWQTGRPAGFRLVIAGDGPLRSLVVERAAVDPTIDYLGWIDLERVHEEMAKARCVVVPSEWYECQPLVLLRSLAVGTPLLVSDLENLAGDVVRHQVGGTFATGEAASLAAALSSLESDAPSWASRAARARAVFEANYSEPVNLASLTTIYRQVMHEMRDGDWPQDMADPPSS